MPDVTEMSGFQWNPKRSQAATLLAEGYTVAEVAENVGVTGRTLYRWKADIEFAAEVDRLTHMVGIATRAERLRIAMRVVRQQVVGGAVDTNKDVLDWLKFAQGETDGVKLDLAALAEAFEGGQGSGS